MNRAWRWIVAVAAGAMAVAAFLFLRLHDKKAADRALVDGVDAFAKPRIERKLQELERLRKHLGADATQAQNLASDISKEKNALAARYRAADLTPDEMADRFRNLRL